MTSAWEELAELYDRMGLPREAEESRRRIALIATLPPPAAASPAPARPTPAINAQTIPAQQTVPDPEGEVVIVSGLPRSGTSMMMQMLAAGGVPAWTDGDRTADDSNPHGYFELTRVLQRTGQQAADDSRLSTAYDDVIRNPAGTAGQLASFLGRPFQTESAAASVDRSLRRSAG